MKVSIFTPTNRLDHLAEAYASLVAQTHTDWEWVLVPNGTVRRMILSLDMANDERIKVVPYPRNISIGVGTLKKFACEQCTGDVLLELDHDDFLAADALRQIVWTVQELGADFMYSDFTNFREDGTCQMYDAAFGWETYPLEYAGRTYMAHRAFDVTPSSLSLIFFAPNHLRAWTRAAYDKAGGYDASMGVCDDFDLVCRTYLSGAHFEHIQECLYFYRLHTDGSNTYLRRNAEIQRKQQDVSNKYTHALVKEWCRQEGLPMYDLGGNTNSPEGFQTVNLRDADVNCNVRNGLPFSDNSVGCIRAFDFLEHIPHCRDSTCQHPGAFCTVGLMNEIYRVLVPGGWLLSGTPSTAGRGAWQDPTHCSFWNPNSFWYYTRRQQAAFVPGIYARFQRARCWEEFPNDWCKDHDIKYVYADLVALKGQRQPGICEI